MGRLMNRHNAKLNAFAVQQLNLTSSDRVLEIGFGGGVTLPLLIKQAGFVGGVDRSLDMVKRAKAIFSDAVSSGRAEFRQGTVEALPFEVSSFGKVCTVNTVYFWSSLDAGFFEIHRVYNSNRPPCLRHPPFAKVFVDDAASIHSSTALAPD